MKTIQKILILSLVWLTTACRSDSPSTPPRDARSCYEQALDAFDQDSVRAGEQLLGEAIRLARREDDNHTLYLAQLRLAESLAWGNSTEALAMAKQALESYERKPDSPRNLIIILDYIGTYASQVAFNDDGSFDEALNYTRRAYELAVASADTLGTELVSQTLTSLANIHWAMDDYAIALHYARDAEDCAPDHLLLGAQQVLARCLVSCDSLAAAEAVYRKMQPGDDLQAAYIVQSNLAKLALRRSDTDAAEEAIDEAFSHAEDLYYNALRQKDDYYQNALRQAQDNERLRYRAALNRYWLWSTLVIVLLIAVAVWFIVRARLRTAEERRKAEAQLHEQEALAQREQLKQRDATIMFLKEFILQRSAILKKIGESDKHHIILSEAEWAEVERTLNAIDHDRIAILRERIPDIKEEDVQLCILTRLRLTNRAIGNLFGITISAVQHRKLKVKKEIFGEEDPETTLEQVIETLKINDATAGCGVRSRN